VTADESGSLSARLRRHLAAEIERAGGWLPFDRFMAIALYRPGLGYYARGGLPFGAWPEQGSDFITAPELSPLFGVALARQVRQALKACGSREVLEFGAGSGALAEQLLGALGDAVDRYFIVDLSGSLRAAQRERLAAFGERVRWLDRLPERFCGVIVGNEVLDAIPFELLRFDGLAWLERGVGLEGERFVWRDRPTDRRPPLPADPPPGYVTEIHPQAQAWIATLAEHVPRGVAIFVDYGFPEAEYYHPQRCGGTLMCHRAHRADPDPLAEVGEKDITTHVNFSGIALAAQAAGWQVSGYTSQAHFLVNCDLAELMEAADLAGRTAANRLIGEHEMGELFKVIALARGVEFDPLGFTVGDRSHRL
jgi:SAM-dependent MidA family methyltransferase